MHSAVITTELRYPAMPLARQLEHKRFVHPGPLVLRTGPLKSPAPTTDRDRTVSRRSEPSSRTALIGEQPNSWHRSACYPRRTFYPLSDGPSMQNHRITKAYFRTCSSCRTHSQPRLCFCTRRLISKQPERSFARLRYRLGGDRPSQTTRLTMSLSRFTGVG